MKSILAIIVILITKSAWAYETPTDYRVVKYCTTQNATCESALATSIAVCDEWCANYVYGNETTRCGPSPWADQVRSWTSNPYHPERDGMLIKNYDTAAYTDNGNYESYRAACFVQKKVECPQGGKIVIGDELDVNDLGSCECSEGDVFVSFSATDGVPKCVASGCTASQFWDLDDQVCKSTPDCQSSYNQAPTYDSAALQFSTETKVCNLQGVEGVEPWCPYGWQFNGPVCEEVVCPTGQEWNGTECAEPTGGGGEAVCGAPPLPPCEVEVQNGCGGPGQPACNVNVSNQQAACGGVGQPPCQITIGGVIPATYVPHETTSGTFDIPKNDIDAKIETVKSNLETAKAGFKTAIESKFSLNLTGTSALPCFGPWEVLGSTHNICLDEYATEFNMIGLAVMMMAGVASLTILLRR